MCLESGFWDNSNNSWLGVGNLRLIPQTENTKTAAAERRWAFLALNFQATVGDGTMIAHSIC